VEKLGASLGLDPRLAQAIGAPISSALGQGIKDGNIFGQNVIQSVQDGLFKGAIAYGVDFASKNITNNALLQSLSSRVISGAVEGTLLQKDLFKGVYDALKQSVIGVFGSNPESIVGNAASFAELVSQKGLTNALEIHLTSVFNQQTIESIIRSGGIASAIASAKQAILLPDGRLAKIVNLSTGEGVLFNSSDAIMGFELNGIFQTGNFGITSDGKFGLTSGKTFGSLNTGQYFEAQVQDGKVQSITTLKDQARLDISINKETPNIQFNTDGNLSQGQMTLNDTVTLKIANGTLDGINVVADISNTAIDTVKDITQKYKTFFDEAYLKDPHTDIIHYQQIAAADMKLDWIGDAETMVKDFAASAGLLWIPANVRWAKAVNDAVPQIVNLMKDAANKFIFTPGVNSGIQSAEHPTYRFMPEIQLIGDSFSTSPKTTMFAHSAGTEAQLKAILKAKQDGQDLSQFKFVFASPRVRRETFNDYLDQAKIRPDQVLVVTAAGDYPHSPTDVSILAPIPSALLSSWFDYGNNKVEDKIRYNYLFLEKDLTYEADPEHIKKQLEHGGPVDGGIENHRYQARFNGILIEDKPILEIYSDFAQGNSQDE